MDQPNQNQPQQFTNQIGDPDANQAPVLPEAPNEPKPTHWMLLEYALSVYFFYHSAFMAMRDILSESPTANGLFPHTDSNHRLDLPQLDSEFEKGGDQAMSDLEILTKDPELAASYQAAEAKLAPEEE